MTDAWTLSRGAVTRCAVEDRRQLPRVQTKGPRLERAGWDPGRAAPAPRGVERKRHPRRLARRGSRPTLCVTAGPPLPGRRGQARGPGWSTASCNGCGDEDSAGPRHLRARARFAGGRARGPVKIVERPNDDSGTVVTPGGLGARRGRKLEVPGYPTPALRAISEWGWDRAPRPHGVSWGIS